MNDGLDLTTIKDPLILFAVIDVQSHGESGA